MRCPSCGSKVSKTQSRCPVCGEPLVPLAATFGGAAVDVRPQLGYSSTSAPVAGSPSSSRRVRPALIVAIVVLALIALALVGWLLSARFSSTANGLAINATNFPDAALRAVVKTHDSDGDGALTSAEIASITSLDCSNRNIASLAGINRLTALTDLNAQGNRLDSVDLSGNTALTSVNLSGCGLSDVNLANLSQLVRLDVSNNDLTALDLSACTALTSLTCTGNDLARLDLSANRAMTDLAADEGQNVTIPIAEGFFPDAGLRASLVSSGIDTDGDGALSQRERESATQLRVDDSSTADLTGIAWLPSLTSLDVSNTSLTSLTAGILPGSLTTITASNCSISTVDLGALPLLISLDISNNPLSSLDLSPMTRLTSLNVRGTQISSVDLAPCIATLSSFWCDDTIQVAGGVARTSAAFPDAELRDALFADEHNPNGDCLLTTSEIQDLTSLNLTGTHVTDLTGLGALTSLTDIDCSGLSLGSLSFAQLPGVQTARFAGCGLTDVDLSSASALTSLDVSNNQLTQLVCAGAPNLTQLTTTGNAALSVIDVRGCAALAGGNGVTRDETTTVVSTDDEWNAYEQAQAQAAAASQQADATQQQAAA